MKIKAMLMAALLVAAAFPGISAAAEGDYDKGVAYLRAGKADKALEMLEPLAAAGADDPYIRYHLGMAYYYSGRLDKAYDSYKAVRRLAGARAADEFRLGVALSNLGVAYYRAGSYDKASSCISDALALDPNDGNSEYYMGLVLMEKGEYDSALEHLGKAKGLLGKDEAAAAAVSNATALTLSRKGDNEGAMAGFAATLEMDPDNVEALYYLGQITYKERGYAAARQYFERITRAAPSDEKTRESLFTTFFNMGVDFQDRGKSETAAEMFEKAARLKPRDAESHYYLGYNLMALERYEDAVMEFKQALSIDPGLDRARSQMDVAGKFAAEKALDDAGARMSDGDYYAALPLYEKALALDPGSPTARKGLEAAKKAVENDTKERAANARALMARGEYTEAIAQSRELSQLNPGSPEAAALEREVASAVASAKDSLLRKGAGAEEARLLGEAAQHYAAVLKLDPGNSAAKQGLSRANSGISQARERAAKAKAAGLLAQERDAYKEILGYLPDDPEARAGLESVEGSIATEFARHIRDAKESFGSEDYSMTAYHINLANELSPGNKEARDLRGKLTERTKGLVLKYLREGDAFMEEGQKDKACKSYEAALVLDPANEQAKKSLERARYVQPAPGTEDEIRRLYLTGVEHYTNGRLDEAVAAWKEVLRADPGNEKALSSIRRAEDKMRQTEDAPGQTE